ncbi:hypothetical protein ATANTOWER_016349 [Ataeniobius toweri]|uniref:Uncharacterized protein n=1 Tax=Ataeniobius toweri TaxID=208326 RepID=A0ABU7A6Q6_9TELE|nr:hypothetical protein [Ataeniobius toweri]
MPLLPPKALHIFQSHQMSSSISFLHNLRHGPRTILEKDLSAVTLDQMLVPGESSRSSSSKLSTGREKPGWNDKGGHRTSARKSG